MFELSASNIIAGSVGLFFIIGAIGNWIAPPKIAADYARWGYPASFHYVTAVLEALAAAMILLPSTRSAGAVLGALVMGAAIATLLKHREYGHAIPAAIVLVACAIVITIDGSSPPT